jgi:threonylcarbamoyladenosine tRNA methylthiotransferase MtaB
VLFESDNAGGFMHGFSENYLKVKTKYTASLVNQIAEIKLGDPAPNNEFIYTP